MANLGRKYTCYSCHTKFYDLGKPVPLCPKCGADQREAEETPLIPTGRNRRIIEEPAEEPATESDEDSPASEEDEFADTPEPEESDEDEEEDY